MLPGYRLGRTGPGWLRPTGYGPTHRRVDAHRHRL